LARIPETPEEIFSEFADDYKAAFGAALETIVLYGSGARGQYKPGHSDLNFMVVLSPDGIDTLDRALPLIQKWRKRNVAVPLMLTRNYIESALDTFPIEFLDMRQFHKVIYGKDLLESLEISNVDLRRQIERELRGKLIYLRQGFLGTAADRETLREMVASSVPAFAAIFAALLFMKGQEVPQSRTEIVQHVSEYFELNRSVLQNILNVRHGSWRGSTVQLQELAQNYIAEIRKLVDLVDKM
jgi:predicted nucleotidyltransferase